MVDSYFRYQSNTRVLEKKIDRVLEQWKSSIRTALSAFTTITIELNNIRPCTQSQISERRFVRIIQIKII